MKVSVVVTTYNRPDALEKVVHALQQQRLRPHEIIIADDGSGPETRAVVEACKAVSDIPHLHVWQEDKGFRPARSRNRAVKAASGDYIVFLDGDCIPDRHFIADHVELAREGWFFQGKRVLVNQASEPGFTYEETLSFAGLLKLALLGRISNAHHIFRFPLFPLMEKKGLSGIRSCNMGMFTSDIVKINGFNNAFEGWGREDSEFVGRLIASGVKRQEHPFRAICYHLWHPERSRNKLEENDRLLEESLSAGDSWCQDGLDRV